MSGATVKEHEQALAAFVVESKQERVSLLLQSARGRAKFIQQLPHFMDWNPAWMLPIRPGQGNALDIAHILNQEGAPEDACVFSIERSLDGRMLPLNRALESIVGSSSGTVVSCIPGRLAYFEGEARGDRCILHQPRGVVASQSRPPVKE